MPSVERPAGVTGNLTHFVKHSTPTQIAITIAVMTLAALIFGAFVVAAQRGCNLGGLSGFAKEIAPMGINLGMGALGAILAIDSAVMLALVYSHLNPKIEESAPKIAHSTNHSVKKPSSLIPSTKDDSVYEDPHQYTIEKARELLGTNAQLFSIEVLSDMNDLLVQGEYWDGWCPIGDKLYIYPLIFKRANGFCMHYFKTYQALCNFCTLNNLKNGYAREIAQKNCAKNIGPVWQSKQTGRDCKTLVLFVFDTPDKDICCFVTYGLETIEQRNVPVTEIERGLAELEKENQIVRQHEWSSEPLCSSELSHLGKEIQSIHEAFIRSQESYQIHTMEEGLYTAVLARGSEPQFFRANDPKCQEKIAAFKKI